MANPTGNPANGRGCGYRDAGGTYLCTGLGGTHPIEYFLIDPWVEYKGARRSRAPLLIRDQNGINHVGMFLSKNDYPSAWDFVEETRRFGASRKIPPSFPVDELIAGKSQMLFFHEYLPDFNYFLDREAPLDHCKQAAYSGWDETDPGWHPWDGVAHTPCTLGLRDIALLSHWDAAEQVEEQVPDPYGDKPDDLIIVRHYIIRGPSYSFEAKEPNLYDEYSVGLYIKDLRTVTGAFLRLPITHVEYKDFPNPETQRKAHQAGFETLVLPY